MSWSMATASSAASTQPTTMTDWSFISRPWKM
jgi:hypothetical protein